MSGTRTLFNRGMQQSNEFTGHVVSYIRQLPQTFAQLPQVFQVAIVALALACTALCARSLYQRYKREPNTNDTQSTPTSSPNAVNQMEKSTEEAIEESLSVAQLQQIEDNIDVQDTFLKQSSEQLDQFIQNTEKKLAESCTPTLRRTVSSSSNGFEPLQGAANENIPTPQLNIKNLANFTESVTEESVLAGYTTTDQVIQAELTSLKKVKKTIEDNLDQAQAENKKLKRALEAARSAKKAAVAKVLTASTKKVTQIKRKLEQELTQSLSSVDDLERNLSLQLQNERARAQQAEERLKGLLRKSIDTTDTLTQIEKKYDERINELEEQVSILADENVQLLETQKTIEEQQKELEEQRNTFMEVAALQRKKLIENHLLSPSSCDSTPASSPRAADSHPNSPAVEASSPTQQAKISITSSLRKSKKGDPQTNTFLSPLGRAVFTPKDEVQTPSESSVSASPASPNSPYRLTPSAEVGHTSDTANIIEALPGNATVTGAT